MMTDGCKYENWAVSAAIRILRSSFEDRDSGVLLLCLLVYEVVTFHFLGIAI